MTREDIVRMAWECGILMRSHEHQEEPTKIERFAALVAAYEREACAKLCDDKVDSEYSTGKVDHNEIAWTLVCAIAIRARGDKP